MPKEPDRSHLADAIHFMDLIDLADEELPAWSSATSTVPVVLCPSMLARKSRWSPDHWFLNTKKPAPLDSASLKLAFKRRISWGPLIREVTKRN